MELPRSPIVLPPKTLPRLRLRRMSSTLDMEPAAAPVREPASMTFAFIAIAFLSSPETSGSGVLGDRTEVHDVADLEDELDQSLKFSVHCFLLISWWCVSLVIAA